MAKFILKIFFILCVLVAGVILNAPRAHSLHGQDFLDGLQLPDGFEITVFAELLRGPRFMDESPGKVLHVTLTRAGKVMALPDTDGDGKADKNITVAKGLSNPHGIAFFKGFLYIAETGRILRFRQDPETLKLTDKEVIVKDLPTKGGGHFTRTIVFGPDGKMYVSVGSSCNICIEDDRRRAAVLRYNPDGSGEEIYAEGLRNSVGIAFHPTTAELFGTDNGRDWLGDDMPPEEVNIIKQGRHYGWPFCYGQKIIDPEHDRAGFCDKTEPPVVQMQAHSAPLGLAFYNARAFPKKYQGRLFIAFHGSWNRSDPTGYMVVTARMVNGKPDGTYEEFASGWLAGGKKHGRPADVFVGSRGALFISDDYGGYIYRVVYP